MTPEIAGRFAEALDREDYAAASALLSPHCRYRIGSEELEGPDSILISYKENGEWAAKHLDSIAYESRVTVEKENLAVIRFLDHIEHRGRRLTHECEQRIRIGPDGLIHSIEHRDLPGEKEKLDTFFRDVGIPRGGDGPAS